MKTIKLYDKDSHIKDFTAKVIECKTSKNGYEVILDRTAFFPEGGGQSSDTGYIGTAKVNDVQINNGIIYHFVNSPVNGNVECKLDWDKRFRKMQNHSGEHIFSGLVHSVFGYNNVGFHLGDEVTVDFDGELNREDLLKIEKLSNEAIYKNAKFTCEYPDGDSLKNMDYRSKLDLTEDVRIVTIDGYDCCACCAPHVYSAGEIGIIKILDFARHRGGVRIRLVCGYDALDDYNIKYDNLYRISVALCAKQNEAADIFDKFINENNALKMKIAELNKEIVKFKCKSLKQTDGNIIIFENDLDMQNLRTIVLSGAELCGTICAGFSGNDTDGYNYVISSKKINLRGIVKEFNAVLCGKGGGSAEMIQGSVRASAIDIKKYIEGIKL